MEKKSPFRIGPATQTLLCADSREMNSLLRNSIDLVVTSPPYPMIAMWDSCFRTMNDEIGRRLDAGDGPGAFSLMHSELGRTWRRLLWAARPGGFICVNMGDAVRTLDGSFRLYPNHVETERFFMSHGADVLPRIIWRKTTNAPTKFMGSGMLPAGAYVTLEHEYILIFRKPGRREFSSAIQKERRRRSALFWEERNAWYSDLWELKGVRQTLAADGAARHRSAAFPFDIAYRLIAMHSLAGDLVLDPFAGTGTTVFAAAALGRSSLGVDIDPALCARAERDLPLLIPRLASYARERLKRHERFTVDHTAAGKSLVHANCHYGFPVKTRQEKNLCIPIPAAIRRRDNGGYDVDYLPPGERPAD